MIEYLGFYNVLHPARVYFSQSDGKSGFLDFESSHPELTILNTETGLLNPSHKHPFLYYSTCKKSTSLSLQDTRVNNKLVLKPRQICTNLSRIGAFAQLEIDGQKVAVSDEGRLDLFDIRCAGRRLFAWDCNTEWEWLEEQKKG